MASLRYLWIFAFPVEFKHLLLDNYFKEQRCSFRSICSNSYVNIHGQDMKGYLTSQVVQVIWSYKGVKRKPLQKLFIHCNTSYRRVDRETRWICRSFSRLQV